MASSNMPVDLRDIQEDPNLSLLDKSTLIWARLSTHNRADITRMAIEQMSGPSLSPGEVTPSPSTSSEATVRAVEPEGPPEAGDLGAEVEVETTRESGAPTGEVQPTPSGSGKQPKRNTRGSDVQTRSKESNKRSMTVRGAAVSGPPRGGKQPRSSQPGKQRGRGKATRQAPAGGKRAKALASKSTRDAPGTDDDLSDDGKRFKALFHEEIKDEGTWESRD